MRVNLIVFLLLGIGTMITQASAAQNITSAAITPSITGRVSQLDQPFGGELGYSSTPALTKTCSLKVVLTSFKQLSESVDFRVLKGEVYSMPLLPDSARWEAPIDSGSTKTFYFAFAPNLVGSHRFVFERRVARNWTPLATLCLDIDEDGRVICAGPMETCIHTQVPPHALRTGIPLLVEFPINEQIKIRKQDRHFSSQFWITPGKTLKDSVQVEFELECHIGFYSKVQFVIEYSTNIALSELPESWGDKAGPTPRYRLYKGRFAFVPLKPGFTQLTFRIVGKHPSALDGDRKSTDFSINLVIGDDGRILFAGSFDPYTRYKQANDPMLGTLQELMAVTNRDFRTRYALSRPDYRGEEIDARDGADSTAADSLHKQ